MKENINEQILSELRLHSALLRKIMSALTKVNKVGLNTYIDDVLLTLETRQKLNSDEVQSICENAGRNAVINFMKRMPSINQNVIYIPGKGNKSSALVMLPAGKEGEHLKKLFEILPPASKISWNELKEKLVASDEDIRRLSANIRQYGLGRIFGWQDNEGLVHFR